MLKKLLTLITLIIFLSNIGFSYNIYAEDINVNSNKSPQKIKEISIPDKNLKAALNKSIDSNRDANQIITQQELETLKSLNLSNKNITDLTGLEYCKNIIEIQLSNNKIHDLKPLTNLTNLTTLSLDNNCINDISSLKNLNNLNSLSLNNQNINANEIKTTDNLVEVNNIIKLTDGSPVQIVSNDDYTYNSKNNTIKFVNILENCTKSYNFNTNVSVGKSNTIFSGIVTHKITYTEAKKDMNVNNKKLSTIDESSYINTNIDESSYINTNIGVNGIEFVNNRLKATIRFNKNTKLLEVSGRDHRLHDYFPNEPYFKFEMLTSSGSTIISKSFTGLNTGTDVVNALNGVKFDYGNIIKFYHREPDKLSFTGNVLGGLPTDLEKNSCAFEITNSGLRKIDINTKITLKNNNSIVFDSLNKHLNVTKINTNQHISDFFSDFEYFSIKIFNSNWEPKLEKSFLGSASTDDVFNALNNQPFDVGDIIQFYIRNSDDLIFDEILNGPPDDYEKLAYIFKSTPFGLEKLKMPLPQVIICGQGYSNVQNWSLKNLIVFDTTNKKLVVKRNCSQDTKNAIALHDVSFSDSKYFSIKILNSNGELKLEKSFLGSASTDDVFNALNNQPFDVGDIIQFYHAEPDKFYFDTNVLGGINDSLEKNNCVFKITNSGFEKLETPTPNITIDDDLYIIQNAEINDDVVLKGVHATDSIQKNLKINYTTINTNTIGDYEVTYSVTNNFGKTASKVRKVHIIPQYSPTTIKVRGQGYIGSGEEKVTIAFDNSTKNLKVTPNDNERYQLHTFYRDEKYFSIKIFGKDRSVKLYKSFLGSNSIKDVVNALNNQPFEFGEVIQFYHAEPSRLNFEGTVINGPVPNIISNCVFEITPFGLKKHDLALILDQNLIIGLNNILKFNMDNNIITQTDLESLNGTLNLSSKNISDLTGIQYCKNINKLDISNNHIFNLEPLRTLTNLDGLYANQNEIFDISPLSKLTSLNELNLENQSINLSESSSIGSKLTLINPLIDLNGNKVEIQDGTDYTYNSEKNEITFTKITNDCNKNYTFTKNVLVGNANSNFSGTVTKPVIYKKIIECVTIPKKITLKKVENSQYVECSFNITKLKDENSNNINVSINPSLELVYNKDRVKLDILKDNSIVNPNEPLGVLNNSTNNMNLKLRAKKTDFKYINKVNYSGAVEFTFSN